MPLFDYLDFKKFQPAGAMDTVGLLLIAFAFLLCGPFFHIHFDYPAWVLNFAALAISCGGAAIFAKRVSDAFGVRVFHCSVRINSDEVPE
jgi:hypothetical protein